MPAIKYDYGDELGVLAQTNFKFLTKLWASGSTLREQLFTQPDEASLREVLRGFNIIVGSDVKILLVDIENARTKSFVTNPQTDNFYALVLPPAPRRHPSNAEYQKMQGWTAAHYHAINDSYGM